MRALASSRQTLALPLIAIVIAASCTGSDGGDASGDAPSGSLDRASICRTNADLLVSAVEELPDQVDEGAILDVAGIHREHSDSLFANDCDLELMDQVDAALCEYLSTTPAAATTNQDVIDATARIYCEPSTGRPDATTTVPPDPPINPADEG